MTKREDQKQDKLNRIIEASVKIFSKNGFAKTKMSEIAEEAGIGKGTIYEYFKSKEDLFFKLFEWYFQMLGNESKVSIGLLSGSASEKIIALDETLMKSWSNMQDIFSLVMEFWAASCVSEMRDKFKESFRMCYAEFRRLVGALLREGIQKKEFRDDIDIEAVAAALVGTWDAMFLQAWFDETFDPAKTSKKYLEVVIRGLSTVKTKR